jgi:hypothetical protein
VGELDVLNFTSRNFADAFYFEATRQVEEATRQVARIDGLLADRANNFGHV